uniref:CD82 antigen n=1 Tax=Aceria tosichella TaxID=561515 RepID=A0A6G1S311_9ACAR
MAKQPLTVSSLCSRLGDILIFLAQVLLIACCVLIAIEYVDPISTSRANNKKNTEDKRQNIKSNGCKSQTLQIGAYLAAVLMLVTTALGIVGTCTRNSRLLKTFAMNMLLVALFKAIFTYRDYEEHRSDHALVGGTMIISMPYYSWYNQSSTPPNADTSFWDYVQAKLKCCATFRHEEWQHLRPKHLNEDVLPKSCCSSSSPDGLCHSDGAFQVGCLTQLQRFNHAILLAMAYDIVLFVSLAILALTIAKPRRSIKPDQQQQRLSNERYVRIELGQGPKQKRLGTCKSSPPSYPKL